MSLFSSVAGTAANLVGGVQQSMRRAKLEGERRVLQRRHRAALEALGARAYELRATSDGLPPALGPSLADVEAVLMEIDALSVEIDAMREAEEA